MAELAQTSPSVILLDAEWTPVDFQASPEVAVKHLWFICPSMGHPPTAQGPSLDIQLVATAGADTANWLGSLV